MSRDSVVALLWPESAPDRARQALTQALYHTRRALGTDDLFIASADLRLNPDVISADVWDFQDAVRDQRSIDAAAIQAAPFLDGFFINGLAEFERWATDERRTLALQLGAVLDGLAVSAEHSQDWPDAVTWRRRRVALDPLNSQHTIDLMVALARAGDPVGALQQARVHEALLRQEFDLAPPAAITDLAEQLRRDALPLDREPGEGSDVELATPGPEPVAVQASLDADALSAPDREDSAAEIEVAGQMVRDAGRPRRWGGFVLASVTVAVALAVIAVLSRGTSSPIKPELLVVAPFRVSGADPSLAYLREGLVDLLATKLGEDSATRTADAGSVMSAWRASGLDREGAASRADAFAVARRLGGGRLLVGSVVGTPARVVISASLMSVGDTVLHAQASVEGPADSVTMLVDRLVSRLLATEAGAAARLADKTTMSARALRAYLRGQAEFRRGRYRESIRQFRTALDEDAGFALAGLGLAQAADRIGSQTDAARGLSAAWSARAELRERDLAYFEALAGPRYPAPSSERARLDAWERAAAAAPERADVWHEFGKRLFHDGRLLGIADWRQRARAAFRRAIDLDSAFASPRQYLLQLAAAESDTAEVRRMASAYLRIDSVGDLAGFVRWRTAAALSDTAGLRAIRRNFATLPSASLRTIALSSVSNGIEVDEVPRVLSILRDRAARTSDRRDVLLAEHALALNRGRVSTARTTLRALESVQAQSPLAERLRILDALYGPSGAPRVDSAAALVAERIRNSLARPPGSRVPRTGGSTAALEDLCVAGQWYAWRTGSHEAGLFTERLGLAATEPEDRLAAACVSLIQSIVAVREGAADVSSILARCDSLLASAALSESTLGYAYLALARLYAAHGDTTLALAVSRRRSHLRDWHTYLATQLREEGRLAAALEDTVGAIRAYRHYLTLRAQADDEVRPEVEGVRLALEQIAVTKR